LREGSPAPIVLPRKAPGADAADAYVIASDQAHAAITAEMITAFVGRTYSDFDGTRARLDPTDPVEAAILEFAGENVTFLVKSGPLKTEQSGMWTALRLMCKTASGRPARLWRQAKPLGILLAEFDAALAAGENAASAELLEQLAAGTGLSGPNLAYLQIKRLARLGRSRELLQLPRLADVVTAWPPDPVREAILAAVHDTALVEPIDAGDMPAVRASLIENGRIVPALLAGHHTRRGVAALSVVVLAAIIRADLPLLRQALSADAAPGLAPLLVEAANAALGPKATSEDVQGGAQAGTDTDWGQGNAVHAAMPAANSWPTLISAAADKQGVVDKLLAQEAWMDWPRPAAYDHDLASIVDKLDDTRSKNVWAVVGAFVDADDYASPAASTARAFLDNALAFGRFGPGDLATVVALTEIILRSAPAAQEYASLLEDLGSECSRWISSERTTVVLDLLDLLCRSACPDEGARAEFTETALSLLHVHRTRLAPDQRAFASQLALELHSATDWAESEPALKPNAIQLSASVATVLLYSLDEGVLARTAAVLERTNPGIKIHQSSDRVGSPQLKQWARSANVVVLATRCAQHAATGFIRSHLRAGAVVRESNGSGSASLIRAAVGALGESPES
jgi:hypothetical protein